MQIIYIKLISSSSRIYIAEIGEKENAQRGRKRRRGRGRGRGRGITMPTLKGKTVECPKCRERINIKEMKSWMLEGGIKANRFRIHLYKCGKCGKSFRKAEPIWDKGE